MNDGTFSFAGGKLKYDGEYLTVDGKITVAEEGTIGCWQVCKDSIFRGSDTWGDKDGMYFGTSGLSIKDTFKVDSDGNATVTGVIDAKKGGKIAGFNIGDKAIYNGTDSLTSTTSGVYLGTDGIRQYSSSTANVTISNGVLNANGANITGYINATSGKIGNCTIENGILKIGSSNLPDGVASTDDILTVDDVTTITQNTISTTYIVADEVSASDVTAGTLNASNITLGTNDCGFCEATGLSTDDEGNEFVTYGAKMYGEYPDTNYIIVTGYGARINGLKTSFYVSDNVIGASQNIAVGSDRRLKQDITYDVEKYRSFFRDLKPSAFHYIKKPNDPMVCGFIAQDVEDALIKNGLSRSDFSGLCGGALNESTGEISIYSIAYEQFIPLLTDAVHVLYERLENIENKLNV